MINLRIGTDTKRTNVNVMPETVLADVLREQGISTSGAALFLNSNLIAGVDTNSTFAQLGVADETRASLIVSIKADSAMINLRIGTDTKRTNVNVMPETKLGDVLREQGISTSGAALFLNSNLIAGVDLESTFAGLGVADETRASLIVSIKADSAR